LPPASSWVRTLRKTESLTKKQQVIIWALRFYFNLPLPARRYVFRPLFTLENKIDSHAADRRNVISCAIHTLKKAEQIVNQNGIYRLLSAHANEIKQVQMAANEAVQTIRRLS